MIYKEIDPKDIITVKSTLSAGKKFYSTSLSSSFLTENGLTSYPNLVSSSQAKIFTAYLGTSALSGEPKNYWNHIVNYFYGQNPNEPFNPNLNYTDTFTRLSSNSSLTGFTFITIDRGQVGSRISTSSITAVVNNIVYNDGNKILFNNINRGTIYNGTTAFGDIFYDYGLIVLYGLTGYTSNRPAYFQTANSLTASSCSAVLYTSEKDSFKKRIFVRLFNYEFNYTNNQTTIKNNGTYLDSIIDSPYTYITEIGLYSYKNGVLENVAVGKLSQPLKKTQDDEKIIQIDIDLT